MKKELDKAEKKGRFGDSMLAHVTPGDLIIPRGRVSPELLSLLSSTLPEFPAEYYTVGNELNSINPVTGLPEFFDDSGMFGGAFDGFDSSGGLGGPAGLGTSSSIDPGLGDASGFGGGEGGADGGGGTPIGGGGGNSLSGWLDGLLSGLSNPDNWDPPDYGVNGLDNSGSGLTDYTPLPPVLGGGVPQVPTPPANPVQQGIAAAPPPSVPQTPVQLGNYYSLLQAGDPQAAANLLAPYLSGNTNIYGR